jgi:hypothetical protein
MFDEESSCSGKVLQTDTPDIALYELYDFGEHKLVSLPLVIASEARQSYKIACTILYPSRFILFPLVIASEAWQSYRITCTILYSSRF